MITVDVAAALFIAGGVIVGLELIGGQGSADNTRSKAPHNSETTTDSGLRQAEAHIEPAAEQTGSGNTTPSRARTNRRKAAGAAGTAFSVVTETARRSGVDRHVEAGFAERAHAEAYAKEVGGKVVETGSSPFAPDNGIDAIVEAASDKKLVQVKHHGQAIKNSTLEQYAGDVDAIAASNGVAKNADPGAYGLDIITSEDWSWWRKAILELRRVGHGLRKGIAASWDGLRVITSHLLGGAKSVGRGLFAGGKLLYRTLIKVSSISVAWVTRRSLLGQLLLILSVIGILYLLWRWYTSEDEKKKVDPRRGDDTR